MSFLKKLINGGEVLETFNSPFNGKMDVFKDFSGRVSLKCDGVVQSGGLAEKLWQKGVKEISKFRGKREIRECLILGLGAGTLVKLLLKEFKDCKITAVEIDPLVIKAGEKYFNLKKGKALKIINSNAFEVLEKVKGKFDLIVVDLYKGQEFPAKAEGEAFFKTLLGLLDNKGIVVFNRLNYSPIHKAKTQVFRQKAERSFKRLKTISAVTNLLLLASN
ncbi:hypothetical protein C4578_03105 [Candidatus Microgenomates bacterium]|jgi:spermidine synthase|nr:MAG: hypothetical protein C4578_03105 [Candidatus Microgenomates bacterium]